MKFKVPRPDGALQREAVRTRLDRLGIELDADRQITAASVEKLGGTKALEAIADKKGRLDLGALNELRSFFDVWRPARLGAWMFFRSTLMAVDGLTGSMKGQLDSKGDLTSDQLAATGRRAEHAIDELETLMREHRGDMLHAPVGSISALATSVGKLATNSSKYLKRTSEQRVEVLGELRAARETLEDPQASAADRARATEQAGSAKALLPLLQSSGRIAEALLKVSDAIASAQIGGTFNHHLGAQLETQSPQSEADYQRALALALHRTQALFGAQLSQDELRNITKNLPDRIEQRDAVTVRKTLEGGFSWSGQAVPDADSYLKRAVADPVQLDLSAQFSQSPADAEALISGFEQVDGLRDLYSEWAGVGEGYSIRGHTAMVYTQLDDQFGPWGIDRIDAGPDVDLRRVFNCLVALHDIGKPVAIEEGDKDRQHEFTVPILEHVMGRLGFSEREVAIAKTLVDNDLLGDVVKQDSRKGKPDVKSVSTEDAYQKMSGMADTVGLSTDDYFRLQAFFFSVDASSYPFLLERVFDKEDGRLIPKSKSFRALEARVLGTDS